MIVARFPAVDWPLWIGRTVLYVLLVALALPLLERGVFRAFLALGVREPVEPT